MSKNKMSPRERAKQRARERQQEKNSRGFGYLKGVQSEDFIELSGKGKMAMDFLPYVVSAKNHPDKVPVGEQWDRRQFYIHKDIGADNRRVICPLKTEGKQCPICEYRNMLLKEEGKTEETDNLKPKVREIFNVRNADRPKDGVKIMDMSPYLFGELLDEEIDSGTEEEAGHYLLEDGFTLEVRWKEKSFMGGKFFECRSISFEERNDINEKILDEVFALDDILIIKPYEDLKALFHETVEVEESEEEEVDTSEKNKDDIPYNFEKDNSEDEEEEEENSSRRKSRRSKREEEPEEEETEESSNRCPADGDFGLDIDELKECSKCEVWEECMEEKERLDAEKRKKRKKRRSR